MIRLADNSSKKAVWDMWKTCFGDSDDYMEVYFRDKYRPENTLLFLEEERGEEVASLQMLPYGFTFHGEEIPILYLSGVCTLPEHRHRGYTRALLTEGFNVAIRRDVPLMLLVPQERWLLELYAKYGFAQAFDPGEEELPSLKQIVEEHPGDMEEAYRVFDRHYRSRDMTVQKSLEDFQSIVAEGALFDFPPKRNLIGMARVIDAEGLLSLFAKRNREASFMMEVTDQLIAQNNRTFVVKGGEVSVAKGETNENNVTFNVDAGELAQLLLGYHTLAKGEPYSMVFPEKTPQMNFMME